MNKPVILGLSLTQPWATLVACGAKLAETRDWKPDFKKHPEYRDAWIAIHAAKGFPRAAQEICSGPFFNKALRQAGYDKAIDLPRSAILAVCKIDAIFRSEAVFVSAIQSSTRAVGPLLDQAGSRLTGYQMMIDPQELAFGNYSQNRRVWLFKDLIRLPKPIPCSGALSLWPVLNPAHDQLCNSIADLAVKVLEAMQSVDLSKALK